jgi:AcrR family transcriptional regulator
MTKLKKEEEKKERKVTSGPLRDKSRTKARMVAAVGKVILKKGYSGLTAINIAAAAGVDTRLVNLYFKSVDNLIEEYIHNKEFWKVGSNLSKPDNLIDEILSQPDKAGRKETINVILEYFEAVNKNAPLQKVVHWEMGESSKMLRGIADKREEVGEQLLKLIDPHFEKSGVDIRATLALMIGGIYYLNLHGRVNGSTCCGVDINEPGDRERILKALEDTINRAYDAAQDK